MILNELQITPKLTVLTNLGAKIIAKQLTAPNEFGNSSPCVNICKIAKDNDGKYIENEIVRSILDMLGVRSTDDVKGYDKKFVLDGMNVSVSAVVSDHGNLELTFWQVSQDGRTVSFKVEDYLTKNRGVRNVEDYVIAIDFNNYVIEFIQRDDVQVIEVKEITYFTPKIAYSESQEGNDYVFYYLFKGQSPDQIAKKVLKQSKDSANVVKSFLSSVGIYDETYKNKGLYEGVPVSFILPKLDDYEGFDNLKSILIYLDQYKKDIVEEVLDDVDGKNVVYYGVPGSGKSYSIRQNYTLRENNHLTVTFHPEYTYYDFLGSIAPVINSGQMTYEFVPGPFSRILKQAIQNPNGNYYLVIEELNRANAASVFGDLFQLLDRNHEGSSEYTIFNKDLAKYVYNDENKKIAIPKNLVLICTMNTSDQNVFTLDTAFKRRFSFKYVGISKEDFERNDFTLFYAKFGMDEKEISWSSFASAFNEYLLNRISQDLFTNEDKQLGPWFMKKTSTVDSIEFVEKVLRYVWDDIVKHDKNLFFATSSFEALLHEFTKDEVNLENVFYLEFNQLLWQK